MVGVCLAAGLLAATLPVQAFTLAWTHSIEKTRWEEDYRVVGQTLVLDEARIRTSGAGMEPPEGARLVHGVWHYQPTLPALPSVRLTHSPFVADYEVCSVGRCQAITALLPNLPAYATIDVTVCPSD